MVVLANNALPRPTATLVLVVSLPHWCWWFCWWPDNILVVVQALLALLLVVELANNAPPHPSPPPCVPIAQPFWQTACTAFKILLCDGILGPPGIGDATDGF